MTNIPDASAGPPDWTSIGEEAGETIIRSIADRAFRRLVKDVARSSGPGMEESELFLGALMHMVYVLADTPEDGADPQMWREAVSGALRRAAFGSAPLPGINGCPLTRDLLVPALARFSGAFARAARGVILEMDQAGTDRKSLLASALAAHCGQIAGGVMERARAEGWDADIACAELDALYRCTETIVRQGLSGEETGIMAEAKGHA